MDKEKLRAHLEQLHAELQQVDNIGDRDRELFQKLESDVRDILERPDTDTEETDGLGDRLREAVAQIEASHPRLTILMRNVIDEVSFMGI